MRGAGRRRGRRGALAGPGAAARAPRARIRRARRRRTARAPPRRRRPACMPAKESSGETTGSKRDPRPARARAAGCAALRAGAAARAGATRASCRSEVATSKPEAPFGSSTVACARSSESTRSEPSRPLAGGAVSNSNSKASLPARGGRIEGRELGVIALAADRPDLRSDRSGISRPVTGISSGRIATVRSPGDGAAARGRAAGAGGSGSSSEISASPNANAESFSSSAKVSAVSGAALAGRLGQLVAEELEAVVGRGARDRRHRRRRGGARRRGGRASRAAAAAGARGAAARWASLCASSRFTCSTSTCDSNGFAM